MASLKSKSNKRSLRSCIPGILSCRSRPSLLLSVFPFSYSPSILNEFERSNWCLASLCHSKSPLGMARTRATSCVSWCLLFFAVLPLGRTSPCSYTDTGVHTYAHEHPPCFHLQKPTACRIDTGQMLDEEGLSSSQH